MHIDKILIFTMLILLALLVFVKILKSFGEHTNADDPLDDKYLKRHNKEWFTNRIGKTIYRKETTCKCFKCKNVTDKGLVIMDQFHADYLFMVQDDLEIEYTDTK